MKFSFIDLSGNTISGECEEIINSPLASDSSLRAAIENSIALEGVLGEFSFYQKTSSDQPLSVSRFAVDNENNVFHSNQLPDFVQIGTKWKEYP
ncbi:hypothetical protein [Acinetobacter stercoris]|uniref:Uncharacterized protein n=1 Tax=Acinetobacter stercoris TaxID=2126983 RepID=A0A2U3MYD0_9GAMM|nr:hypothetical protein [Acinetobacter stercoris]SPL70363.1 hypothetical protein KPC_1541 [Acinetobacter stercoris]